MAKRFTDTDKWKRPFFRSLSTKEKLIWLYLCDDCDHAGIWLGDFNLMSFNLGFKVSEEDLFHAFGEKIEKYGDKYLIVQFFEFQYGHTKKAFGARKSASNLIAKLTNNIKDIAHPVDRVGIGLYNPLSIGIGIGIGNSIGLGKSKNKSFEKNKFQDLYESFPRKVGKKKGFDKLRTIIKSDEDVIRVKKAIENYRTYCQQQKLESKFIKHFTTFLSEWEDWLDPDHGKSENFKSVNEDLTEEDVYGT